MLVNIYQSLMVDDPLILPADLLIGDSIFSTDICLTSCGVPLGSSACSQTSTSTNCEMLKWLVMSSTMSRSGPAIHLMTSCQEKARSKRSTTTATGGAENSWRQDVRLLIRTSERAIGVDSIHIDRGV